MTNQRVFWAKLFSAIGAISALALAAGAAESIGGKAPARAARSVHLQWSATESEAFYVEATVERTAPGTYVSAMGWAGGYFGIQEVRDGKKVAIFSVWDPTKGDDPKAVRVEDRVELLHEDEGVRIKRFGGEGTGGQCMVDFPWAVGEAVRFLVRAETHDMAGASGAQEKKSAYSGWIFDPQRKAWRHLVTFRTRNGGKLLRGIYSFVEDFRRDTKSVDDVRRAGFANVWAKPFGGVWQPVTQAKFTASRADWEARDNINAGATAEGFFLATGGDTKREPELNAALKLPAATAGSGGNAPAGLPAAVFASSAGAAPK